MLRVTCDGCGKELQAGEDHHVVKIEVFAAGDPAQLTEEDLDEDHMEVIAEMLRELEAEGEAANLEPSVRHFRYDLCAKCKLRYVRDPLGKEASTKFQFSKN